jgi:methyl acetate hydrolase
MAGDGALTTEELDAYLSSLVDRGTLPHVTALAATRGGQSYTFSRNGAAGDHGAPLTPDSVIWLASMTKLAVAVAALQLVEQGALALDAPLADSLPDAPRPLVLTGFDSEGNAVTRAPGTPVTLRHLLSHTAGYAYSVWEPRLARYQSRYEIPDIFECRAVSLGLPLMFDPGTAWAYGMGLDFVGQAIERASGLDLEAYLQARVFGPLGMKRTSFVLDKDMRADRAAMLQRQPDGGFAPLQFEVNQSPEFYLCGAGLYGPPAEYLRLLRALLNLGTLDGTQVLRPETVRAARENQIGALEIDAITSLDLTSSNHVTFLPRMGNKWSLLGLRNDSTLPNGRSHGSMFWCGMANCYYWVDWDNGDAGLLCAQVMPFADDHVLTAFDAFEQAVHGMRAPESRT